MSTQQPKIEQSETARAQSAFIGRLLVLPLLSLPLLALWVVIAVVLTPISTYDETMSQIRWLLIGFGIILIALCDAVALLRLLDWSPVLDE